MIDLHGLESLSAIEFRPDVEPAAPAIRKAAVTNETLTLLNRIAPGASRAERARVAALGYEAYLEEQLNPAALDDSAVDTYVAQNLTTLVMNRAQLYAQARLNNNNFSQIAGEFTGNYLLRALYSRRQLFESMVGFWSDVLNIQLNFSAQLVVEKALDDRAVVRTHAFGRFRDLIGASAKSPAMLIYLDNASNGLNGSINENYARELMELHTLGVDGGFSESDVIDVARCLSGWTLNRVNGDFMFQPSYHDNGSKLVLGVDIAAGGGLQDGETVLDLLAAHPSTARFIATRLIRRFVTDTPSAELITAVAQAFSSSNGDIKSMLRALFLHPSVRSAPAAKFKRPQEFTLSLLRVLEATAETNGFRVLAETLLALGHSAFTWPSPDGYPDSAPYWLNTDATLKRWNYAINITRGGQRAGWRVAWSTLLSGVDTLDQLVVRVADIVGIGPLSGGAASLWFKTAQTVTGRQPLTTATRDSTAATLAALMLSGESFQLR
ncbi:MAG: DUF1800 domain-containing protein [Pseudomarimonas sp.]